MKRWKLIEYRGNRSQREMAKKYFVTQQTWSAWERGVKSPDIFNMRRLARDIGAPMEMIFYDVFYGLRC